MAVEVDEPLDDGFEVGLPLDLTVLEPVAVGDDDPPVTEGVVLPVGVAVPSEAYKRDEV